MPSRRWMWVRPTPHIYAYNRELSSSSAATTASSVAGSIANARSIRASSEFALDRSTAQTYARATSVAPAPGTSLTGYTGYYGRQLALHRQTEESRKAESASRSASVAAASAASAASRQMSASAASRQMSASASSSQMAASSATASRTAVSAQMTKTTTTMESVNTTTERQETILQSKRAALLRAQESSIKEGRQSISRAVRRAEKHAESSGRDPRHVGVPRETGDDILKKIADVHMTPFDTRELGAAKVALNQGRLKIDRMEKELNAITSSAMKFQSLYTKSAAQMAKEAMMACEAEAASSTKKTRKTVIEETKRGVHAA